MPPVVPGDVKVTLDFQVDHILPDTKKFRLSGHLGRGTTRDSCSKMKIFMW